MTDWLDQFEKWLRAGGVGGRGLGEETISTYLKVARMIAKAKSPTSIIRPDLTMATKLKYIAVLRQWAAFTNDDELADRVKLGPKMRQLMNARSSTMPRKIEAFTDAEVSRFLKTLERFKGGKPEWAWPCISLQVYLGLRVGADLAGLRHEAVVQAVKTGKLMLMGKRDRMDEMPAGFVRDELRALAVLPDWDIVADLISPESRGQPEHKHRAQAYQTYRKVLLIIDQHAKIGASKTHRFRHWAITNFIKNVAKGDYKRAQRFARHSNLETTLRYYRTVDISEDDAALAELKRKK